MFPLWQFRSAHEPNYGTVCTIKEHDFVYFVESFNGGTCDTPNCWEFSVESYTSIEQFVWVVEKKNV